MNCRLDRKESLNVTNTAQPCKGCQRVYKYKHTHPFVPENILYKSAPAKLFSKSDQLPTTNFFLKEVNADKSIALYEVRTMSGMYSHTKDHTLHALGPVGRYRVILYRVVLTWTVKHALRNTVQRENRQDYLPISAWQEVC